MLRLTRDHIAPLLILAGLALILVTQTGPFWRAAAPTASPICAERVFLREGDEATGASFAFGSITRSGIGPVSVRHVFEPGRKVLRGPDLKAIRRLDATDFAFLTGSDPNAQPDSVPRLAPGERVVLEGFPARAGTAEIVEGKVYAADTVPPGLWITLDHPEPLVGGFSGGCVRRDGVAAAVIMGASTMRLDGRIRHFARVVPISDALREAQGHRWETPRTALLGPPLPVIEEWK